MRRSCQTTDFRFFQGSSDITRCTWYFTPPGALVLPFENRFGSRIYDFEKLPYSGIGEQRPQNPVWENGANTWGYVGLKPVGDPSWWIDGIPGTPADYPDETDDTGKCPACFAEITGAYSDEYGVGWDRLRPI